jgi:hypothetical protein
MPFTTNPNNQAADVCYKLWSSIGQTNGTHVVYVPDGSIFAETPNGDGTYTTYQINKTCCDILKNQLIKNNQTTTNGASANDIYFDLDEQKCRWAHPTNNTCSIENTPIKVVLNPKGNDGSLFTFGDDDICRLDISFDYLVKFDCKKLSKFVTTTNKTSNNTELKSLNESKFQLETSLSEIDNQLDGLAKEHFNTNYSITCNEFPVEAAQATATAEPIVTLTEKEKSVFSDSGFGSLTTPTSITSRVAPKYNTAPMTFCITDAGLKIWEKIITSVNFAGFINGDPNSYTCANVIEIYNLNQQAIINNQDILIYECTTPFGTKTELSKKIIDLGAKKNLLLTDITLVNEQIFNLASTTNSCDTLLGQFQNITLSMSLDIVNDDGSTTSMFGVEPIFGSFANNNELYDWLLSHPNNSGFLVCGDNTIGCSPIVIPEFSGGTSDSYTNTNSCEMIKNTLINQLSSISQTTTLSPNIFNSQWISYSGTINEMSILSGITGHKVKLNIIVNSSCGDFCLLVDNINITRVCDDINRTNIFIGQSPGFELTKVIDNKKSWIEANNYTERNFYIGKYDDTNKIRQTEYSVDEERLVLNSKEIDLTMNMASAVENDVWCYLLDNPNLLTGVTCTSTSAFTPTDIYDNKIILPTAQTYTYNVNNLITSAIVYFRICNRGTEIVRDVCIPDVECSLCGTALKIKTGKGNESLWVTCDDFDGLGAYYISDNTEAQNTIYNITYSLTGSALTNLTNFIDGINANLPNGSKPYEIFWDENGNCSSCCQECGDDRISFTGFMTNNITEVNTLETFQDLMVSELTDAKNRKVLSAYPTLRAVYDRYMNSTDYGVPMSNEFDYQKMDKFTGLIKNYWDDLIEQVVPATTMWGSIKVYTNTMFDQQKFKYRSYTSLFCNSPLNFVAPPSPINGSLGQCHDVEVKAIPITTGSTTTTYNSVCLTQMNWGSEFVGNVDIQDGKGVYLNNDTFCSSCRKAVWYSMPESPAFVMNIVECGLMPETGTTFVIQSISASSINNGSELVSIPLTSDTINKNSVVWVEANNTVISACTLSNPTGWTYTNFVDFLNDTFMGLGMTQYEAKLSYIEITNQTLSDGTVIGPPKRKARAGFYLIFPENDTFEIKVTCTTQNDGLQSYTYTNNNLYLLPIGGSYITPYANTNIGINFAVDYDCKTNKINE